jgi:cystathionine beta-lyase family protein involved in aluminum resistance
MTQYLVNFGIGDKIKSIVNDAESELGFLYRSIDATAENNQYKVIDAFGQENISPRHFSPSTGYGYSDEGREALSKVFARIVRAEKAVLSPHIAAGTHAIALALFAVLRPMDTLISVTGAPYDTLSGVIGGKVSKDTGSLSDFSVKYKQVELLKDSSINIGKTIEVVKSCDRPKVLFIQRSRGYAWRKALSMQQIREFAAEIKKYFPEVIIIVDNCYGEFCETEEPVECGADLIAGSMIKNPGGGLAPTGGYIAGRADLIELVENRLVCPGAGYEIGSYEASYRSFFQGLFFAPHVVSEALKGSILAAKVFENLGYEVYPAHDAPRSDITQSIKLGEEKLILAFAKGIQKASAVDSRAVPVPWDMPGYDDKVIMAAGTFVQGASIELSADAPIRPPYIIYLQGGLTYPHAKLGIMCALSEMGII